MHGIQIITPHSQLGGLPLEGVAKQLQKVPGMKI
jgi:hypothetical protein